MCDVCVSTDLYTSNNFTDLRRRLEEGGYVWVRGVIPTDTIQTARDEMLLQAARDGSVVNTKDVPYSMAHIAKKCGVPFSRSPCK